MAYVAHDSRGPDTSRPRKRLEGMSKEKLLRMAINSGLPMPEKTTKPNLVEMLTTDRG